MSKRNRLYKSVTSRAHSVSTSALESLGPVELREAIAGSVEEREREHAPRMEELRRRERKLEQMLAKARRQTTEEELAHFSELKRLCRIRHEHDEWRD
jgi:predicted ATPase